MDKLGKILRVVINQKGLRKAADAAELCYLANNWANGRFLAISYSQGCLKLQVQNHCQAQECQMLEEELVDYLEEVASAKISRVRWEINKSE